MSKKGHSEPSSSFGVFGATVLGLSPESCFDEDKVMGGLKPIDCQASL